MHLRILAPAVLALLLSMPAAAGKILVVTHRDSAISTLSLEQASHLFLGRVKLLPSGEHVKIVEVEPLRAPFYRRLVSRDIAEINAYWARLQFSGRTQVPLRVPSSAEALAWLVSDRNAIAFVEGEFDDPRTKVVLRLDP
jgi:hypothetical protein